MISAKIKMRQPPEGLQRNPSDEFQPRLIGCDLINISTAS